MISVCKECGNEFETNRAARDYCGRTCANRVRTRQREKAKPALKPKIVWSCGGGVQSSAIAALIIKGRLPKPDYAVMVDVGYEKASTWENVCGVLQPALAQVGVNLQIIKTTDYRTNELFDASGHLIIPAYRLFEDGTKTKFNTHCSGPWKQKVVMKWLRDQGVEAARDWLGITTDEARRVRTSNIKWFAYEYPLIRLGMDRVDCHTLIYSMGWERVLHSSCYLCPQQDDEQWRYIKNNYPDDWAEAVAMDKRIREIDAGLYLHRSCLPLDEWVEANPGLGALSCGGGCEYCM